MSHPREVGCPANRQEDCRYAPDCHLSEHHLFPRRTWDTPLKKKFGALPVNRMIVCRNIHDMLDQMPEPNYPNETEMDRLIMKERDAS